MTPSDEALRSPSVAPSGAASWRLNLLLFLGTIGSVFATGWLTFGSPLQGAEFAGSLLSILVAHESGHYIAARLHKVDASLPYFLPLPILSPFGTMGAVIRMKAAIPTRKALLDIGAAGPLAGLALAIPLYIVGVHWAEVKPIGELGSGTVQLGESLLTTLLDHVFAKEVPAGSDLVLGPVAFGAWGGFFVTMINLLPAGQLDAGHVSYALLGPRQNAVAQFVHKATLAFFVLSLGMSIYRDIRADLGFVHLGDHVSSSMFWLVWFEILAVLGAVGQRGQPGRAKDPEEKELTIRTRLFATLGLVLVAAALSSGDAPPIAWVGWLISVGFLVGMEVRWGSLRPNKLLDHPPTGPEPLGVGRAIVAVITLIFFVLLFMPQPYAVSG